MTLTQHYRALIRWATPQSEENREWLFFYSVLAGLLIAVGQIFQVKYMVGAIIELYGWAWAAILSIRLANTVIIGIMYLMQPRQMRQTLRADWRELGEEHLFGMTRSKVICYRELRQDNYSRRFALSESIGYING